MKKQRFESELELGHKGSAVIVPFDPAELWKTTPEPVPAPWKLGHLVKGSINKRRFEGWIGKRWGRFFIIIDEELQTSAGIAPGDTVQVEIEPRAKAKAKSSAKPAAQRAKKA